MRAGLPGLYGAIFGLLGSSVCIALAADQTAQPPAIGQPDQFGGYATGHILVRLAPGMAVTTVAQAGQSAEAISVDGGPIDAAIAALGVSGADPLLQDPPADAQLAGQLGLSRTWVFRLPAGSDTPSIAAIFAALPGVELAEIDGIGGIAAVIPNDPSFASQQWDMNNTGQNGGTPNADINMPEAWTYSTGSASVIIGVIDTGVQADHPELTGRVLPGRNVYDNPNTDDGSDVHGHGTHCAGIAAARGNNAVGVAGVNWNAQILPVRCVGTNGTGTEAQLAAGITWATDHGAQICNMSLQYYTGTQTLSDSVTYAYVHGVLLIAAAGNNAGANIAFPARFEHCMAIGATNYMDQRYSGSNTGPQLDLSAPGELVYNLWRLSGYSTQSGTSMATPHVVGVAALLKTLNPALIHDQIAEILVQTTHDLGAAGFDQQFGWGRLDAYAAVRRASPLPVGDMNCDGVMDNSDIDGFVQALIDPSGYVLASPTCPILHADINGDGIVDNSDIDPFVDCLLNGCP